ncbi:hypothetical protein Spb1_20520 [Planctopirus ephydatiae]|uniref:Secreted protein n=1 Tax=Planctopirus ephydatiae TaxID=2528019 RepID=A0A518GNK7_9PLAN|nr:hypothetical protein [Planctopirus ephydatiae]QDV30124.1 hypothetical protein Spb1_20520 [Planctopirus ephydatiae]
MLQRLLVLLVTCGLLVQGMAFPHVHAAGDLDTPSGHTARPHIHTAHSHHGHSHEHGHGHHSPENSTTTPESAPSHDDSAIYVGDLISLHVQRSVEILPPVSSGFLVEYRVFLGPSLMMARPFTDRPPDPGDGCPLYLRLLSLRV